MELEPLNRICPKCGNGNYMRRLVVTCKGKKIPTFDVKCINCNRYFRSRDLNKKGESMTHNIKIKESFADAVNRGDKTFEVRKNDRGYQKGDHVRFEVLYDSDGCEMIDHPLSKKCYEITYVLSGWGIEDGYCVFGIKQL